MKRIFMSLVISFLTANTAFAFMVCEGTVGEQKITLIESGPEVWLFKGVVNLEEGSEANKHLPHVLLDNPDNKEWDEASCSMTASGPARFVLNFPCEGNDGAGKLSQVSIRSLGLEVAEIALMCRNVQGE